MICTLGSFGALTGFPMGSVVEYATDERGRPVFAFSSLSGHTSDVRADPRCSLTVTATGFSVRYDPQRLPERAPAFYGALQGSKAFNCGLYALHSVRGTPGIARLHEETLHLDLKLRCVYILRACMLMGLGRACQTPASPCQATSPSWRAMTWQLPGQHTRPRTQVHLLLM